MSSLKVTPTQLETLGGSAHRVCGEVRGQHQHLRASLAPLFGADWAGSAAGRFAVLFDEFDSHAKGLFDALDGIADLLIRAGASYADVEQQIAASFR